MTVWPGLNHREDADGRPCWREECRVRRVARFAGIDDTDDDRRLGPRQDQTQTARKRPQLPRRPFDRAFRENAKCSTGLHVRNRGFQRRSVARIEAHGDDALEAPKRTERGQHHFRAHHPSNPMWHDRLNRHRIEASDVRRDNDESFGANRARNAFEPFDARAMEIVDVEVGRETHPTDDRVAVHTPIADRADREREERGDDDERREQEHRGDARPERGFREDSGGVCRGQRKTRRRTRRRIHRRTQRRIHRRTQLGRRSRENHSGYSSEGNRRLPRSRCQPSACKATPNGDHFGYARTDFARGSATGFE
ncbi:MAG: hypothetical protein RL591_1079 [Planctomycetota bacterium]